MDSYNSTFASVARHVPRTLRHQLICKLTSQFLESYGIEDDDQIPKEVNKMEPTMERFYAALLFVDISGFTGLAQKLDVESLKNHINDYFTKMLNVIDKWEGDVIKFAGDALYIVWSVEYNNKCESNNNVNNSSSVHYTSSSSPRDIFVDNSFINAAKSAAERAVSCALEINACCCNHKVLLQETATSASAQSRWSKLFNSLPVILGQNGPSNNSTGSSNLLGNNTKVSPLTPAKSDDKVAYLNVHSGVGFGLLAGVDVGCRDRWEFFLLGEPISQVANAESLAQTGDVVISDIVHSLIHPYDPAQVTNHNGSHNHEDMFLDTGVKFVEKEEEPILPCGCCRVQYDFFRISKQMTTIAAKNMSNSNDGAANSINKAKFRRSKSKAKFDEFALNEALQSHEEKLYEFYAEEIEGAFACIQLHLKQLMWLYLEKKKINCRPLITETFRNSTVNLETRKMLMAPMTMTNSNTTNEDEVPLFTSGITTALQKTKLDRYIVDFLHHQVRDQFYIWISKCLIDDLVKHAHEAARGSRVEFFNLSRLYGFQRMMMKNFEAMVNAASGNNSLLNQSMALTATVVEEGELDEELDSSLTLKPRNSNESSSHSNNSQKHRGKPRRSSLVGLRKTSSQVNMIQDASLSAEMRTVTVLFVKIDGLASNVTIDDGNDINNIINNNDYDSSINNINSNLNICGEDLDEEWLLGGRSRANAQVCYDRFYFLQRSAKEAKADATLLKQLQACMEVLVTSFASKGGHLRQFIIDDKGTVCIGTFGLRGAMAGDNAAAALETAKRIIIDLQAIDLTAAIGITSGKAYCGIVGSPTRHEYAVMGPSVNLSARLMCQAMACTVICDNETKSRDRAHAFEPLQEVVAKGYVQPVMTYKPVFVDLLSPSTIGHNGQFTTKISEQALSALSPNMKWRSQNVHPHGFLRSSLDVVAMESYQQFSQVLQLHRDSFDLDNNSNMVYGGTSRKSIMFSPATTNGMLQLANANNINLNNNNSGSPGIVTNNNSPFSNTMNLPNLNVIAEHTGSHNNSFIAGEVTSTNAFNAIVSSEFYIQRKRGSREFVAIRPNGNSSSTANANAVKQLRLYGRDKEISEIIEFLFLSFTVSSAALLSAYHHSNNTINSNTVTNTNNTNFTGRSRPLFDLTQPCKLLAVTGNEGSGKSALVTAVAKKLVSVSRQDLGNNRWNLTVLKNKPSTLHANVPFYPWIFVVQDMLLKVHRLMARPSNNNNYNSNRLHHLTIEQQMQSGLMYLQKYLSPETQQLIPLLGSLNILPTEDDSDRTQYMQGRSRYLHSLELLFQLLQAFPVATNRLVFTVLEKLCLFDPWSLSLLHRLWKHGKGFTFLVTYCPLEFQSAMKTIGAYNGSMDLSSNIGGSIMLNGPGSILFNPKSSISHSLFSNAFNTSSNKVNMQLAAALATATNAAYISRTPSVDINNNVNTNNNGENTNNSSRNVSPNRTLYSTVHNHSANSSSNKNNMSMKNVFVNNRAEAEKRFFMKYWDDSRFHRMELKLLDKDAISSMVRDTLQVTIPMKSSVLDRVYDLSGGNPLYAFEIANSINASAPALAALIETDDNEANNNDNSSYSINGANKNDISFSASTDKNRKRSFHDSDADGNDNNLNNDDKVAASLEQILAVTSNRIEEVICYRFDQQPHLTQVMLKAASVICFNGAHFTLDMLIEVLSNSGGYNNDVDRVEEQSIMQALAELVLREEFLQIVQIEEDEDVLTMEDNDQLSLHSTITTSNRLMSPSATSKRVSRNAALRRSIVSNAADFDQDDEESGFNLAAFTPVSASKLSPAKKSTKTNLTVLDNATIKRSKFSFRVVLEQITLYNLLVREKKERLHDAVANYYYRRQEGSVETLLEEAFHWQHAMVWAHALSCYYKAALKVWEVGNYEGYQQQLQAAFRIYHYLRSDVGITQTYEVHLDRLKELFTQYHHHQYQPQALQQQQTPKTSSSSARNMILSRNNTINSIANSHCHSSQNVLHDDITTSNNFITSNAVNMYQNNVLSTELIHEMCYSDNETLSTILQTHVRTAQFNILTLESPLYTTLMLEEALQLLILSHAENAQLHHSNSSGMPSPSGGGPNIIRFNSNIRSRSGSGNNSPSNRHSPQHGGNNTNSHLPFRAPAPYSPRSPKSALYAIQKASPNQSMDDTNNNTLSSSNVHSPSNNSISSAHYAAHSNVNNSNNLGVMYVFKKNPGLLSVQTQTLSLQQTQPRFKLVEYVPIHLSLYAAFIHMHTWAPTSNSQRLMKAEFVQHYFAKLAKQQKPLKESVHYIQALSQTISLYIRYTQLKEAWMFGKKLIKLYKVESHNAELVALYGVDMCNFILALLAQQLFLVGDIQHGTLLLEKAIDNWKELAMLSTTASISGSSSTSGKPKPQTNINTGSNQQQLMYSLHLSFLPICGCLVLFHRYEEAIAMVDTMSFLDGSSHHVSSSLALLPQVYKTDMKSILVLQMKLVEGLLVNNNSNNKVISPSSGSSNSSSNQNNYSTKFDSNAFSKKTPKRPSIRASMFLQSSAFASAIRSSDINTATSSIQEEKNDGNDEGSDKEGTQQNQQVKTRLRRSLVAAENHVLPPTLAEDEEYAPKKQSYLSHLMFLSGVGSEALKIDVELLKVFSSPVEKEAVAQNPSAVMKLVAEKYEKLSAAKNADFDAMVLSELWPLITLLVLFRRSNYQSNKNDSHNNNAVSNKFNVNSSKTSNNHNIYNNESADTPASRDTATTVEESDTPLGSPPSPSFIAPKAPDVPRSLIKAVIALIKRCEQHQYFLATAILGFFLSEMQVPLKVQEIGEKVTRRAFESIRQAQNSEKYDAFEESFRLIVKGDFTAFVVTPRHDVSDAVSGDEKYE